MRSASKRVILGIAVLLAVTVAVVSWALYPRLSNLKSEYTTADVIRDLDVYVAAHPGEWPKSWKDLGEGTDRSAHTKFRFDLSAHTIVQQPELIHEAALPASGHYQTYPHAKSQLDEVLKKLSANARAPVANDSDPIEKLVAKMDPFGLWLNGLFPSLNLPHTASTEEVVAKVFKMTGFDKGNVTTYRIIEKRQVRIPTGHVGDTYTAVLVDTDLGRKIVLLQSSETGGWWSRVYEAEPSQ